MEAGDEGVVELQAGRQHGEVAALGGVVDVDREARSPGRGRRAGGGVSGVAASALYGGMVMGRIGRAAAACLAAGLLASALAAAAAGEAAFTQRGEASFYSDRLHGKRTASGARFRQDRDTAASRVLPLGARASVTNEETGRTVEVTVTDRGPHVRRRIIDLSRQAAEAIGLHADGVARVRVEARPSAQPNRRLREAVAALARKQAKPRK